MWKIILTARTVNAYLLRPIEFNGADTQIAALITEAIVLMII